MTQAADTFAKFKLLTPTGQIPVRGSQRAAGLDVCADLLDEDGQMRKLFDGDQHHQVGFDEASQKPVYRLMPGQRIMVPLGIAMATSDDIYPRIGPRSGMALKHGIQILGGVVDADYRGMISAILLNTDFHKPFEIHQGARIAQIIMEKVWLGNPEKNGFLDDQARGAGGFGSTGQ
jgi:dUTP pyrophosphatase